MTMQQYCLRWNNHQPNFISVFSSLLTSESLVDVTLAAEGRHLQAHKVVLSACSSYFQSLFTVNPCQHPIVILKDVQFADLKVMVDFMYYGEVNVSHDQLPYILKTAEMLKIKGLAEIPVDQSVTKHNNSVDRAELLTPGESNWSSDGVVARQTITSSPCPLSPSSRRKRLRKSSTGSGSGSTERPPDEQQSTGSELLLTSVGNVVQTVIKSDPGSFTSDGSSGTTHKMKQHSSSDSEILRGSSHESVEEETTHQITLQVPQHEMSSSISHNIESSSMEIPGPSSTPSQQQQQQSSQQQQQQQQQQQPPITEKSVSTTHAQLSQQLSQNQQHMGTKRGRFLIRQPRVKRESDPSQAADGDPAHAHYLSVPPLRVERQCSEPLPAHSPPPGNLLTVPGAILVKQHSHPLLPSQIQQPSSPPLQIQLIPQSRIADTAERATSPVVIINDFTNPDVGLRTDAAIAPTTTLRVRTDELKRSASSPQSSTRSSHCPVVRPGPALGCNYCWNTVDNHGRILRRKTKYHCPECQTNLCIVPCFQEYHERAQTQTDPIALTTSVMRMFPKTTSM